MFSSVGGAEGMAVPVPSSATGPGGMDEVDHHGNTPLLLALQLGRLECANVSVPDLCRGFEEVEGGGG